MKKRFILSVSALLLAGLFAGCTETDPGNEVNTEIITAANSQVLRPTVWEAGTVKVIDCILSVQNTLTIEPGCTLQFTANGGIEVGMSRNAALIADGTPDKPITFTSVQSARTQTGSWYGLTFGNYNTVETSLLNNCIIEGAGRDAQPAITVKHTQLYLDSCIIRNSAGVGVKFEGPSAGYARFSHNTLANCSDFLLSCPVHLLLTMDTSNVFTSAVNKYIAIEGGSIVTTDTLKRLAKHFAVLETIQINNAQLTIEPGCTLRFASNARLEVGYNQPSALIAEGEPGRPIVFTSAANSAQAGDWPGIYFSAYNQGNTSILKHAVIEYAGRTNGTASGAIVAYTGFKLFNSTIRDCMNYGVFFNKEYIGFTACTDNTIQRCEKDPIYIYATYAHTIGTGNTLEAGQGRGIHVKEGVITRHVTWLKHTVPYIMDGNTFVEFNYGTASLTLKPGCDLRFMANSSLEIDDHAKLVAIGTAQDSIFFTSNARTKSPADWGGINFWYDIDEDNELKYCRIDYAGSCNQRNIGIYSSNVKITHCAINHSLGNGIVVSGSEPAYAPVILENTYVGNQGQDVFYEE